MSTKLFATISYVAIFAIQVPLFMVGLIWFPDVVDQLVAYKYANDLAGSQMLLWSLTVTAVVISPVLLAIAPYQIAYSFWEQWDRWMARPRVAAPA